MPRKIIPEKGGSPAGRGTLKHPGYTHAFPENYPAPDGNLVDLFANLPV